MSRKKTKNFKRFKENLYKNSKELKLSISKLGIKLIGKDEKFKQVSGYELYYISNHGRLISNQNNKYKLLKPQINGAGYSQYTLCAKDKPREQMTAHRLVAEAFCKGFNPDYRNEVHHINHIKVDNYYKNLIWVNKVHHALLDRDYQIFYMSNYENSDFVPVIDLVDVAHKIGIDIRLIGYKLRDKPDQVINDMEIYSFHSNAKYDYHISIIKPSKAEGGVA